MFYMLAGASAVSVEIVANNDLRNDDTKMGLSPQYRVFFFFTIYTVPLSGHRFYFVSRPFFEYRNTRNIRIRRKDRKVFYGFLFLFFFSSSIISPINYERFVTVVWKLFKNNMVATTCRVWVVEESCVHVEGHVSDIWTVDRVNLIEGIFLLCFLKR